MRTLGLVAAALAMAGAAQAGPMVCRAAPLVLRIELLPEGCRVGQDMAIRRDGPEAVECLLSNPQLRVITLYPDGRFSYLDTDNDTFREGRCSPT